MADGQMPAQMGKPGAMKKSNPFFGVMPIAVMAFAIMALLLLIFISID